MPRLELCTILDAGYVTRCLVLHRSLLRHGDDVRLSVWTVDAEAQAALEALALPGMEVRPVEHLYAYDPELEAVSHTRSMAELCWTAKSVMCTWLLDEAGADAVTYIDSDTMFWGPPEDLLGEIGDGSVLLVPHWPKDRWSTAPPLWDSSGVFNAGLVSFRGDADGRAALRWWRGECIRECSRLGPDGRIAGDQRYLTEIPERFDRVTVLDHLGGILAPWNGGAFTVTLRDGTVFVEDVPLLYFHYHSMRIAEGSALLRASAALSRRADVVSDPRALVWRGWHEYAISRAEQRLVWRPYVRELATARTAAPPEVARRSPPSVLGAADVAQEVARHWLPPKVLRRAMALSSRG